MVPTKLLRELNVSQGVATWHNDAVEDDKMASSDIIDVLGSIQGSRQGLQVPDQSVPIQPNHGEVPTHH